MILETEKINDPKLLSEMSYFLHELDKASTNKEIASLLLKKLDLTINAKFSSFVVKENNLLKVILQTGEINSINNILNKEMCKQIYDWVINQKQLACLKISEKEQFAFVPLVDIDKDQFIEHGMLVFQLKDPEFEFTKELNIKINILSKIASMLMTRFLKKADAKKYIKLKEEIKSESILTTKLQRAMSGSEINKKILFSVLEDEHSIFNGNLWWISELGAEITLVLIAQVLCKGTPAAILSGYILGEMNGLKTRAEISLKPNEVLRYLNQQLNPFFINTGITVNAWYGVFNIEAKKVRFANANYPDPFLIGSEQQVSNLIIGRDSRGKTLGQSLSSEFEETLSYVSSGSKLVICTEDLLEHASKIGDKYDPSWLPQVLETIGSLSLSEMTKSLSSLLSENSNGTGSMCSRLALLLEIPS